MKTTFTVLHPGRKDPTEAEKLRAFRWACRDNGAEIAKIRRTRHNSGSSSTFEAQ